jgi:hypothetical protein
MKRTPASLRCLAGFMLMVCLLGGPSSRVFGQVVVPGSPDLSTEQRTKLLDRARDPRLEPWQRDFMRDVATPGARPSPGREASDRLRSTPLTEEVTTNADGEWSLPVLPPYRSGHTAIYDPLRDRMVVFGGYDGSCRNDTWALTLAGNPTWSELTTARTPPPARRFHTAIYDPVRDRMVIFGGDDGSVRNDTWALSLAGSPSWRQIDAGGEQPSGRKWHGAIYDPVRDRMVIFGGYDGHVYLNDTWGLSLGGPVLWRDLAPTDPPPSGRGLHTTIYDPVHDRMVAFGGYDGSSYLNDAWGLSLAGTASWRAIQPTGPLPSSRAGHTAIYDPVRQQMVIFGGYFYRNDTWALSLAGAAVWSELTPLGTLPSGRDSHTAIHDPVRDIMIVFGGLEYDGSLLNDVPGLRLEGTPIWSEITPLVVTPPARMNHTAIWDPVRSQMVIYGGYDGWQERYDTWFLSFSSAPIWRQVSQWGYQPEARDGHTAIYDPVRDRMVIYGGFNLAVYGDTWGLPLTDPSHWSQIYVVGETPSGRSGHTAIYDPVRDRMVIFGGWPGGSPDAGLNDTWALSIGMTPAPWSQLAPLGTPPSARFGHAAIYDPVRDRIVVFGGYDGSLRNDAWALSLSGTPAWSQLNPSGAPPSARSNHTAIYDPVGDRMVVFGGMDASGPRNDTWALSLGVSLAWSQLAPGGGPPSVRYRQTAIYDPLRDHMVIFGGRDENGYRFDTWELAGLGAAALEPGTQVPLRLALRPACPNPASGPMLIRFELPVAGSVRLAVFDVNGRLVRRLAEAALPAGTQQVQWDGRDEEGRGVTPGVYYANLEANGQRLAEKVVILR